jgi:hypothetical protein
MLSKITAVEAKLFFREPGIWLLTILLPTFVRVVVGLLFGGEPTTRWAVVAGSTSSPRRWSS